MTTDPDEELLRRAEAEAARLRATARRFEHIDQEQTGSIRREAKRASKRKQQRKARKRNRG